MAVAADILAAGFSDAVIEGQAAFRAILDAMAEPGTQRPLAGIVNPPAPLSPVAAAVALALCDADTPVWLGTGLAASAGVAGWFAFHTGSPIVREPGDAHFAFCSAPEALPLMDGFAQGSQEYPDRSTTLVLQVSDFATGERLILAGPGIPDRREIAPRPMPRHFREQWRQNNAHFPRGVDLVLAGPRGVVCLPRTTRIVMEG